jgi:hypothetical protein
MVDGKEQDGILKWVRERKHLFGGEANAPAPSTSQQQQQQPQPRISKTGGPVTINSMDAGSDDEDEDFVASSSDSDSGSESDSSKDASGEDEEEAVDSDSPASDGVGGEDIDPAKHPLMQPGAVPKNISKAALDAAVGLVETDILMGGPNEGDHEMDELED